MGKFIDITGQRFGRLTAIKRLPKWKYTYKWLCKCDCGNETTVLMNNLRRLHTTSCGCHIKEIAGKQRISHGMSYTRIHSIWRNMKKRCSDPNSNRHSSYFDKNITVCDKWLTFEGFYEDMAEGYADNLSIDRLDNSKGYYKENCRWATATEQTNNQTRNKIIEVDGIKDTLANICRAYNVNYKMARDRLLEGWTTERAIKQPKTIRPTH
jgi:hypothetical protein